jgi:molybdenum cofactor synthesis domain-containing protein
MHTEHQITCELIAVGNELLIGKTLDTNSNWLARMISALGGAVKQITTIDDDLDAIQKAIHEALSRNPQFIITTGGLGPTFDDKTLQGIAQAFGLSLELDNSAYAMLKAHYHRRFGASALEQIKLTPERLKMAIIPSGSTPLQNPVGTAPAVMIKRGETTIISLPGVPSEMKAIFENSIAPLIIAQPGRSSVCETTLNLAGILEADLSPLIDAAMKDNPRAYIKSHPKGAEHRFAIELHIRVTEQNLDAAKKTIGNTVNQMVSLILEHGGKIESISDSYSEPRYNNHP